jgi:hypothetical protein
MKKAASLITALAMLAACNDTPVNPDSGQAEGEVSSASQKDEVAKQKLSIEQAAEEATKLIEADAKAEIEAGTPAPAEPAQ